ncbi:MAG: hypothetical protein IJ527_09475 [Prevotella sp.]|nr:hypothetical protein [Prevotella sp.]
MLTFIMVAMLSVGFVSCGSDDDDGNNNSTDAVTSAKVGEIYYSDGTCSNVLVSGKKPIGIVVYVGNDAVSENMHGLVMALNNSGKEEMYYTNYGYNNYTATTIEEALSDMKGFDKTKALAAKKSHAAVSAVDYNVPAPSGTTGWFIPSIGQWIAVANNFGANITKDSEIKMFTGGSHVLSGINNTLSKVGIIGTDYTPLSSKTGSGQEGYFWSSSFSRKWTVWDIVFNEKSGVYVSDNCPETSALYIRPFLAF